MILACRFATGGRDVNLVVPGSHVGIIVTDKLPDTLLLNWTLSILNVNGVDCYITATHDS